jgi:hypothetical protein
MEKSLRVTQQAYLVISDVQSDFDNRRVLITLDNTGHMPADNVSLKVYVHLLRTGISTAGEPYEFGTIRTKIFPGTLKTQAIVPLENLTEEDAEHLRAGEINLLLLCQLEYENGFGFTEENEITLTHQRTPNDHWEILGMRPHGEMRKRMEEAIKNQNVNRNQAK